MADKFFHYIYVRYESTVRDVSKFSLALTYL